MIGRQLRRAKRRRVSVAKSVTNEKFNAVGKPSVAKPSVAKSVTAEKFNALEAPAGTVSPSAPAGGISSGGEAALASAPAPTTAAVGGASPAAPAPLAVGSADLARQTYGYMAWALDEPELGPILNKAAAEGWDENRMRGAIFATGWFKTHGTAKVASQLKEQADAYLVPMDDGARKNWAMKVITGEVQGAEVTSYLREQAKSLFPSLSAAIDRGITVADYAAPYRALAAQTLEVAPESINLADGRWRRALDGSRDDKGQPASMSLSEWERTIKTDSQYGFDQTKGARTQAAEFSSKLSELFGRTG